jgi:hypothetical protein
VAKWRAIRRRVHAPKKTGIFFLITASKKRKMRDWERAQAHYRSAERYAAVGNDDKAASHTLRGLEIARSRFGGLNDLGRLFGKKNSAEKQTTEYDTVQDKLQLFLDLRSVVSLVLGETMRKKVGNVAVSFDEEKSEICVTVGNITERAIIGSYIIRTGYMLVRLAYSLDECLAKLQKRGLVDTEQRVYWLRVVVMEAVRVQLDRIEKAACAPSMCNSDSSTHAAAREEAERARGDAFDAAAREEAERARGDAFEREEIKSLRAAAGRVSSPGILELASNQPR